MRWPNLILCMPLVFPACPPVQALGILELRVPVSDGGGGQIEASLAVAFPDSLSGTDVHALLTAVSGTQTVLLPGGQLRTVEADFVEGLRAFSKGGSPQKADSLWARLRGRRLEPALQSAFNVNMGFLLCLRGDTRNAETLWKREWNRAAPAREAAWRNLLALYLAQRNFETRTGWWTGCWVSSHTIAWQLWQRPLC